jgi:hypothetical protein
MPIFISYSHANRDFVDKLAGQLVREKVHVWLDRWELSLGDSLIDKVQDAVQGAGALLVVLSKASVESEWCKKELTAGLFRELDEKRVVVMPVLLEDCAVPMFLRDKFYADFRTDFDAGLRTVLEGVAKISNASLAREISADNHTDWSIASGYRQGQIGVFLTFVQQDKGQPYTVVTEIGIFPGPDANAHLETVLKESGKVKMRFAAVGALMSCLNAEADVRPLLKDEEEWVKELEFTGDSAGQKYQARIGVRRLGQDTGKDILGNTTAMVRNVFNHMKAVLNLA